MNSSPLPPHRQPPPPPANRRVRAAAPAAASQATTSSSSFVARLHRLRAISPGETPSSVEPTPGPVRIDTRLPLTRVNGRIAMLEDPDGPRAAGYRVLRHHLPLQGYERARVTMVSSAHAGEASTRCAINLALALNDYHRGRVLLVDANFSNPTISPALELHDVCCFATQLASRSQGSIAPWAVAELLPSRLHVLSVTRPKGMRPPLYDAAYAEGFVAAMESLREAGYEHIIVAAPPVLESAQPTLMQKAADGVILTCRSGRSRETSVQRSIVLFGRDAVIGLVLDLD